MFACIYIPDFPVEAIARAEPLLRERPIAVLEGKPPLVRVIALNEKARALGMFLGMTKLQAAVFAGAEDGEGKQGSAVLRRRSLQQESSAHAALLDVVHAFTPRVEDTAEDTLLLDLAGLERLYGEAAKMARELVARVGAMGLEANIGVAANPDAALHAARGFTGVSVIAAGQEAQRLGTLPLRVLLDTFELLQPAKSLASREQEKLGAQMLETLESWGVRDFRALALLPEHALASRLGEAGTRLQRMARGTGMRTLTLCEPVARFEEAMELESPVETLEPLSFLLNQLLGQLCARLEARALAVQELRLRLQRERRVADEESTSTDELRQDANNDVFERVLRLPVAMRDVKVFLKLLQLELAAHPPGAPVTKVSIAAEPAPPRSAQRGLFLPVTPEVERLEITLARINGVVGERRAGIARLLDSHRRDGFRVERFAAPATSEPVPSYPIAVIQNSTSLYDAAPIALRIIRPPCALAVRLAQKRPVALQAMSHPPRKELQGKIVWSAGPWRSSGDWWAETSNHDRSGPWDREEWDVALANGDEGMALYRIYRDLGSGHWFVDASYD